MQVTMDDDLILRLIQGLCPVARRQESRNVKSISNYDTVPLRSVRYAKDRYDAEARRSKLFTLLAPCMDEELAGNIATT
jgi:hypothetical protein